MPSTNIDYLIVGQGLAGSLLSYKLLSGGASIMVFDSKHHQSATRVAAGIINPITGHRWNLTQDFFKHLSTARTLYTEIESSLNCKLFSAIPQSRLIKNKGQAEFFQKRLNQPDYQALLELSCEPCFVDAGFASAAVAQSYRVDSRALIEKTANYLNSQHSLCHEKFDYTELKVFEGGIRYKKYRAKKIIFCEGFQALSNPWLQHLPFKLAKGSVLELKISGKAGIDMDEQKLLNWGHWLILDKGGSARLGSTYDWNDTSDVRAQENQEKLLASLQKYTNIKAHISAHETGVRPTTKQRKPFVGSLSNLEHAYCLNGLGSKGCLIAPHYVALLEQHIKEGSPMPDEVCQWI